MSTIRIAVLISVLAVFGFILAGCDEDSSPTTTPPETKLTAENYFPFETGAMYNFENYLDDELMSTETWNVLSEAVYHDRAAFEVVFTLYDPDDVELGNDTTWYAFDEDSVFVFNDDDDVWDQDPFLSGWLDVEPPATHEFTRVREDQGGVTIEYVAGYHGDDFDYVLGATTYAECRKITEDADVVGQDHVASGVRYYAPGVGLLYSDLTDTYDVGGTEITLHREKFRTE